MLAMTPRRRVQPRMVVLVVVCFVLLYWTLSIPGSREKAIQAQFDKESTALAIGPQDRSIYGNTLRHLVDHENEKHPGLRPSQHARSLDTKRPYIFNPYPDYDSPGWRARHSEHFSCKGPRGGLVEEVETFKGRLSRFPEPGFGSFDVFGLDPGLCFERDGRLGHYGNLTGGKPVDWDKVDWGELQKECTERNKARFALASKSNEYMTSAYGNLSDKRTRSSPATGTREDSTQIPLEKGGQSKKVEHRTALILRSYTGKHYTENDKQTIRSLITELNLRTGGEYQVFLFVQVKEKAAIWQSDNIYQSVIQTHVPREFWNITVLWDETAVQQLYPKLSYKAVQVGNGQWLPIQSFVQRHREFDFIWNWEMDSRLVGHYYDLLSRLAEFGRLQPRKELWERNERFYIPSLHGRYDTDFRAQVHVAVAGDTIWRPPKIPLINPIGPKPPVATPEEDNYQWGVGEDADLITLMPMFNPKGSLWILRDQVWGFGSGKFSLTDPPRRATIITQSRVSRKLLDIMHVESLRRNHLGSEMATQTVALLHGLKAVYAPMPIFFDRPWTGEQLAKWFNGGIGGTAGGHTSAMGWGKEARFQGATWYYRADPPQRMYNHWLGYEDSGIGGADWESEHGRPCLPTMLLHPVKDSGPTRPGITSESKLPYR